jgi:hypothetical protein
MHNFERIIGKNGGPRRRRGTKDRWPPKNTYFPFRMGLYLNFRQLLLSALEKVSSSKMPILHSVISKITVRLQLPEEARDLRLAGDLVGLQPLVQGCRIFVGTTYQSVINIPS